MHDNAPLFVQLVAIAIGIGILAQVMAGRARLPSIVFLLGFGVLVGPDVLGWIDPEILGQGLPAIVTIAVALILFEGGLELRLLDLAAVGGTVRNLVTVGAGVTVVGAAVASHYIVGVPWPVAFLFGAIVSVTGPTVISPLLNRVKVKPQVDTILRGEGILIDPVGAILTVVVLDVILSADTSIARGLVAFASRMAVGIVIGVIGGWALGRVLRMRGWIAEELKNLFVLAWVLLLFVAAEAVAAESGLATVVIAGMAVRRESIPRENQLRRFKGELSVLFISILFILLSAHLPLATLAEVGWAGVATVLVLMFVIRPISILASTWGENVPWRQRAFLMWISPRGVVAISIASFIALRMESGAEPMVAAGLTPQDGEQLLALVFLTIAITVVVQGLTAEWVARLLRVNAEADPYCIIVGANALGRRVATLLRDYGWDLVVVDTNARNIRAAKEDGLVGHNGDFLEKATQDAINLEDATAVIALTRNQTVNFLVSKVAIEQHEIPAVYPVLVLGDSGVDEKLVAEAGGDVAFGRPVDIERWSDQIEAGRVKSIELTLGESAPKQALRELDLPQGVLPVVTLGTEPAALCHGTTKWADGDCVVVLVDPDGEVAMAALFGVGGEALNPAPGGVV